MLLAKVHAKWKGTHHRGTASIQEEMMVKAEGTEAKILDFTTQTRCPVTVTDHASQIFVGSGKEILLKKKNAHKPHKQLTCTSFHKHITSASFYRH